jgi:hypothetical protein
MIGEKLVESTIEGYWIFYILIPLSTNLTVFTSIYLHRKKQIENNKK